MKIENEIEEIKKNNYGVVDASNFIDEIAKKQKELDELERSATTSVHVEIDDKTGNVEIDFECVCDSVELGGCGFSFKKNIAFKIE
jgi:hypothetical protein